MLSLEEICKMIEKIGTEGYRDGSSTKGGWIYHPVPFKEFSAPTHKVSTVGEFDHILRDYGNFCGKRVLDIGCANGYFAFNMAAQGACVTAYEGDSLVYDVCEAIREYKSVSNIRFINKYFDETDVTDDFDVVIMMNVHMWIRKQIGADRTYELMKNICGKTKTMYFQTAHSGSGGGYMVPELNSKNDILVYLLGAGFKRVKCIGKNDKWFNRFLFGCYNG